MTSPGKEWVEPLRKLIGEYAIANKIPDEEMYKFCGVQMLEICVCMGFTEENIKSLLVQMARTYMRMVKMTEERNVNDKNQI